MTPIPPTPIPPTPVPPTPVPPTPVPPTPVPPTPVPPVPSELTDKITTDLLQLVQDFTDTLTIKRIFTVLLAGICVTLALTFYESRDALFEQFFTSKTAQRAAPPIEWDVTTKTKDDLMGLVRNSKLVTLTMITEIDLQKNRRKTKFWFLVDPQEVQIRADSSIELPQAVFDYDSKNTQQMVAVLNNEFACSRFTDTVYARMFPTLSARMPVVCRIAIPPFYGRFVGVLAVGLNTVPTKDELDSIRLEVSRLAVEIYLRDVMKKPLPST